MNVRYFVVNYALFWFWGYARETSLDLSKSWVDNNIRSMFKWATFWEILLPSSGNVNDYVDINEYARYSHLRCLRDKLFILWILNRQAKIFLRIVKTVFPLILNYFHSQIVQCTKQHEPILPSPTLCFLKR